VVVDVRNGAVANGSLDKGIAQAGGRTVLSHVVGDDVVCLQLESDDATAICSDALEEAVALRYALLDQEAFACEERADGRCGLGRVGDDHSFSRHNDAVFQCVGGVVFLSARVEVGVGLGRWQWKLKPSPRHAKTRARSPGEREAIAVLGDRETTNSTNV
jgi:hypothetical protein